MINEISKAFSQLKPSLLNSLANIIKEPSVLSPSTQENQPFGEPIDRCLSKTLEICEELGFTTYKDPQGYYGYAEAGQGEELIGILCHLDVVPVEDPSHWINDPFNLYIEDDKLIARGVADDKGPTVICMYALKAFLNMNIPINKRFRLIFGTDEENLWRCIHKYIEKEEIPCKGFTPDGSFPVTHAEKGLLQFFLIGPGEEIFIKGGGAFNAVPNYIDYSGPKQSELRESLNIHHYAHEVYDDYIRILGKSVHAQSAQKGINPIVRLMICLKEIGLSSPSIDFISKYIQEYTHGEILLGNIKDDVSGKITTNLSSIEINKEFSKIAFDFRIPVTYEIDKIVTMINSQIFSLDFTYQEYDRVNPLYLDKNDPLVQELSQIYHQFTGLDPTPLSTGGATYSRTMKNFVTFGMSFPNSAKTAHETNEYITIEDLEKSFIIYTQAIINLNKI